MPNAGADRRGLLLRARHRLEYGLLKAALAYLRRADTGRVVKLAERVADLGYWVLGSRRRIALANLLRTGIAADRTDAVRLARASFRHFAVLVVESLKSDALFSGSDWQRHVRLELPPELAQDLAQADRGIIVAAGHFGNWEVAAQVLSLRKPVAGITSRVTNPYVDRLLRDLKPRNRFHLVAKQDGDSQRFVSALRAGDALAIMIDQHGGRRGMKVDFLGQPASTHTAIALLHLVTGAPIYYGSCRRTGLLEYAIRMDGPLQFPRTGDKQADILRILEDLNARLERDIRECPEQYMWGHRRWHADD